MKKPNILLITSDQQHWDTIGAFNNELHTPNLDRLVREGTTFRAYCPNPTCTPSRASIITGMYPFNMERGRWAPNCWKIGIQMERISRVLAIKLHSLEKHTFSL